MRKVFLHNFLKESRGKEENSTRLKFENVEERVNEIDISQEWKSSGVFI